MTHTSQITRLILASSSKARQSLLQRLKFPFISVAPDVDETPYVNEYPIDLVRRLAELKAQTIAKKYPDNVIIGSDQVAVMDGMPVGKPANHAEAIAQLKKASGNTIIFQNGLCVINTATDHMEIAISDYSVTFKTLTHEIIETYLEKEKPYECACSLRSEGLGIALIEHMSGDDPTGLIGLPLITLTKLLQRVGLCVFT